MMTIIEIEFERRGIISCIKLEKFYILEMEKMILYEFTETMSIAVERGRILSENCDTHTSFEL